MVQLTRIYTKGGDKGKTSLGNGERLFKNHPRLQAIGSVDESNAALGMAGLSVGDTFQQDIQHLQNDLFDLGADLCMPQEKTLKLQEGQVLWMENRIDALNQHLSPLKSFVLPGGSPGAAALHLARTIVRRAERDLVELMSTETLNPVLLKYLNRLSDLLFVMARTENNCGETDVLWTPAKHQDTP